jgi:hypothetical protein
MNNAIFSGCGPMIVSLVIETSDPIRVPAARGRRAGAWIVVIGNVEIACPNALI